MSGPQNETSQRRWEALGDLARAATPGPWEAVRYDEEDGGPSLYVRFSALHDSTVLRRDEDAHFIAAVSPDVVLALIAELERVTAEKDRALSAWVALIDQHQRSKNANYHDKQQLRAELGAVRLQVEAAEKVHAEVQSIARQFQRNGGWAVQHSCWGSPCGCLGCKVLAAAAGVDTQNAPAELTKEN